MPVLSRRYFESEPAERRLAQKLSRIPPENRDDEATVRWGVTGTLESPVTTSYTSWPRNEPEPPDEEPDRQPSTLTYTEQSRETEEVKVTSEDDPDVFVTVERITSITFRSSHDGISRKFVLKW